MREILFRAKHKEYNEWVEGDLIHESFGECIQFIKNKCRSKIKVDPETVCQYTGLTDKNGRKIFEGDIVKTSQYGVDDGKGHYFAGLDTFSVEFSEGSFCLKNKWRRFNLRQSANFEIIGNIFDNPELIKPS